MFAQNRILILCFSTIIALLLIDGHCAYTSENIFPRDPRIINGTDASLNATRHQVSIRSRRHESVSFGKGHQCGGSLISENVVLTAAHCFLNSRKDDGSFLPEQNFVVVMGNLNRSEYNSNNTLIYDIAKIITWSDHFDLNMRTNDILLVILNGKVPAGHPTVKPITLNEGPIPNNTICQVTGWGITEEHVLAERLKIVDVPFIDFDTCRQKTNYGSTIREGMLCAGYLEGKRDSCTADSGGPLTCRGIQAGIVSWGIGCAVPLNPGVYVDVAYYKNWILEKVSFYNGTLPKFAPISGGVTNLTHSIFLISLIVIFEFLHTQVK